MYIYIGFFSLELMVHPRLLIYYHLYAYVYTRGEYVPDISPLVVLGSSWNDREEWTLYFHIVPIYAYVYIFQLNILFVRSGIVNKCYI